MSGEKLFRADAFFCFGVGLGRGAFCNAVDRLTYSHAPPLLNSSCLTQMGEDSSPPRGGVEVHCKISLLKQLILESIDAADQPRVVFFRFLILFHLLPITPSVMLEVYSCFCREFMAKQSGQPRPGFA